MRLRDFYRGLRCLASDSFPRKCSNCGKVFATAEEFLFAGTKPVCDSSGLRSSRDEDDRTLVEVFRNCTCGTTLMELFEERRDTSPPGTRRRREFGRLLMILSKAGIEVDIARRELLKIQSGRESEYLASRGFKVFVRKNETSSPEPL